MLPYPTRSQEETRDFDTATVLAVVTGKMMPGLTKADFRPEGRIHSLIDFIHAGLGVDTPTQPRYQRKGVAPFVTVQHEVLAHLDPKEINRDTVRDWFEEQLAFWGHTIPLVGYADPRTESLPSSLGASRILGSSDWVVGEIRWDEASTEQEAHVELSRILRRGSPEVRNGVLSVGLSLSVRGSTTMDGRVSTDSLIFNASGELVHVRSFDKRFIQPGVDGVVDRTPQRSVGELSLWVAQLEEAINTSWEELNRVDSAQDDMELIGVTLFSDNSENN